MATEWRYTIIEMDGWYRPEVQVAGLIQEGQICGTWQEALAELRRIARDVRATLGEMDSVVRTHYAAAQ